MDSGPQPTVNSGTPLRLATAEDRAPQEAPTEGVLSDLKEVREGAVSLVRLWGRLSAGSKATVGAALVTLLGPLALTVYTHAEEVWQGPATVALLAAEFEDHRAESRREHEQLRALVEGIARKVGAPTSAPASQP